MNRADEYLLEQLKIVAHKIAWEGFDYCFRHYSDWGGVIDEEFHRLRKEYLNGKAEASTLEKYIEGKIEELQC